MKYAALASTIALASAYDGKHTISCHYWYQFDAKYAEDKWAVSNDGHTIKAKEGGYSNYTVNHKIGGGDGTVFCANFDAHNLTDDF